MVPTLTAPAPAPAASVPRYCYPKQYAMLLAEVTEHQLEVLHSDGLYRHLRFAKPGTGMWSFELITWPGYLTIVGDIGAGYTFARVPDMLTFFDTGQPGGHINASYWSEKLTRGAHPVLRYSEDKFTEHVHAKTNELAKRLKKKAQVAELRSAVEDEILSCAWNEEDAARALEVFVFADRYLDEHVEPESFVDYDHHFLIALHAILWGAKKYHAHLAQATT